LYRVQKNKISVIGDTIVLNKFNIEGLSL